MPTFDEILQEERRKVRFERILKEERRKVAQERGLLAPSPEEAKAMREGQLNQQSGQRLAAAQKTMGMTAGQDNPLDNATAEAAQRSVEQGRAPGELSLVPEVRRFEQLAAAAKPGQKIVPVGGTAQLQGPDGAAALQLRRGAAVPSEVYEGQPFRERAMGFLTGAADVVDKAAAAALRAANYTGQGPLYRDDEGVSEVLQKTFADAGEAAPATASVLNKPMAALRTGVNALGVLKDKVDLAKHQNRTRMGRHVGDFEARKAEDIAAEQQELAESTRDMRTAGEAVMRPLAKTPQEGRVEGEDIGAFAGDVYDLVSPLQTTNLALSAVGPVARKLGESRALGDMAEFVAGTGAGKRGADRGILSATPAAVGAPTPVKGVIKAAESAAREFPGIEQARLADAFGDYDKGLARQVLDAWHDPRLRRELVAQRPEAAQLFERGQLTNLEVALASGVRPEDYNPFHVYVGQDPSKAARVGRTASAEMTDHGPAKKILQRAGVNLEGVGLGAERNPRFLSPDADIPVPFDTNIPGLNALYANPEIRELLTVRTGGSAGAGAGIGPQLRGLPESRFLPGARVADSRAQRAANMVAGELAAREKANPIIDVGMRAIGRSMDDTSLEDAAREIMEQDVVSGLSSSMRKIAQHSPERQAIPMRMLFGAGKNGAFDAGSEIVTKSRATYGPEAFTDLSEYLAKRPGIDLEDFPVRLNAYGDEQMRDVGNYLERELVIPSALRREMQKQDLVMVLPKGSKAFGPGAAADMSTAHYARQKRTAAIPGMDWAEPKLVPRRVVEASLQITSGAKDDVIRNLADDLEFMLGAAQANARVTQGNPGFALRNLTANATRAIVDQGAGFLTDKAGRQATEQWMFSPENRRQVEQLLGVGKDLGKRGASFGVAPVAPGIMPAPLRRVQQKAFSATQSVGQGINEAMDEGFKAKLFPSAPKHYTADDMLRVHHFLSQVRKGVDPSTAALATNELLINYADKSSAERALKAIFPFVRYYTGALQGALRLSVKEPYKFSRLFQLANLAENAQNTYIGDAKAVNAKAKRAVDVVTGMPTLRTGRDEKAVVLRPETPLSEGLSVIDPIMAFINPELASKQDAGLFSLVGPSVTGGMGAWVAPETMTRATGRRPMSVGPDLWKALSESSTTLPGKSIDLWKTIDARPELAEGIAPTTAQAKAQIAWDASRNAPFLERLIPTYMDALVRSQTQATGYTSRTPEDSETALMRLLLRSITGARTQPLDIQESMAEKSRQLGKIPPPTQEMINSIGRGRRP